MRDGKQGGAARLFVSEHNTECLRRVFLVRYKPCIFMQIMRKRIRVYSACRNCVNSISHAHIPHIKVAHMPHKYILQVSDAEFNSGCMLHIVSYTTRDA